MTKHIILKDEVAQDFISCKLKCQSDNNKELSDEEVVKILINKYKEV